MKVLLSAIACHPEYGSEAKVGWDAACAISKLPEVKECHVMTHGSARDAILRHMTIAALPKLRFHFYGDSFRYNPNRLLARFQSWLHYREWQTKSVARATQLHRENGFSLAHHVTYATWRLPSELWRLPIPFVFGPVGGGSRIPHNFRSILGFPTCVFESLRDAASAWASRSKALTLCCSRASAVLAADEATAEFLASHGAKHVRRLCQVFFSESQVLQFRNRHKPESTAVKALSIFAGGNLEGRKGTSLSLRALRILKNKGIPFSYTYGGWGPELETMKSLAGKLGLTEQICFHEGYAGTEYAQQLADSDVYLLPSIRETAGITMMEAIMAGCYPIVMAGTGAGDIAACAGGSAIKAENPEQAIHEISQQLEWCYLNRAKMRQRADSASEKIRSDFSERNYQKIISDIYAESTGRRVRREQALS